MTNKENLKKQIIYRSSHRGSKEMDLLLGNFVKKNIENLNDLELNDLNHLMSLEDEILKNYYFGINTKIKFSNNKIIKMFKDFKP